MKAGIALAFRGGISIFIPSKVVTCARCLGIYAPMASYAQVLKWSTFSAHSEPKEGEENETLCCPKGRQGV